MGTTYSGSSVGGTDGGAQLSLASRHSSMLSASQEADAGGYRTHPSAPTHYGGQYSSVYGSAALSVAPQVRVFHAKFVFDTFNAKCSFVLIL